MKKILAITAGEPAGIGYDILAKAAQNVRSEAWLVFADPETLQARAGALALPLKIKYFHPKEEVSVDARTLTVWPTPCAEKVIPGKLNPKNAASVIQSLTQAAQFCLKHEFRTLEQDPGKAGPVAATPHCTSRRKDFASAPPVFVGLDNPKCEPDGRKKAAALVTLPVHKGIINEAGFPFTGHTEFFAQLCGIPKVVMMLAAPDCRVALVTTHLPLKRVAENITPQNLRETISILYHHLQVHENIPKPRLLVMGLNPHAGENGHIGREEIEVIIPTLTALRQELDADFIGPLPADTLFQPKYLQQADAIIAMYHDQGLAPLKARAFGEIVNITCGLPFIRTSVDHGVALDIAGTGAVNMQSFFAAIRQAQFE